ncbi:hypothetical protein GCM10018779_05250 [Streptomyces griseocarneus]|nr:hypothetical protein GCM10018779_05250 [Streptomyces griseocarneus]
MGYRSLKENQRVAYEIARGCTGPGPPGAGEPAGPAGSAPASSLVSAAGCPALPQHPSLIARSTTLAIAFAARARARARAHSVPLTNPTPWLGVGRPPGPRGPPRRSRVLPVQ